jgi:CRISPR-associated protein Csx10
MKDALPQIAGPCRLGRSKKDDYGLGEIRLLGTVCGLAEDPPLQGQKLFVWCISDVLTRSATLNAGTGIEALKQALERELKVDLELAAPPALGRAAAVRTRRIDSWHDGWGLPRPSLIAIQSGSCAVFGMAASLDRKELARVERDGIGERRAEGYGQVAFNRPLLTADISMWSAQRNDDSEAPEAPEPMAPGADGYGLAERIERAAWRTEIARVARTLGSDDAWRKKVLRWCVDDGGQPPKSQLGGLRSVIGRLKRSEDRSIVNNWLEALERVENRKNKWPQASIAEIQKLIAEDHVVWSWLTADLPQNSVLKHPLTKDGDERLRRELWGEAVRTVFEAAFDAHARAVERLEAARKSKEAASGAAAG